MPNKILFTSLLRNNEIFVDYLDKCFSLIEKENPKYEFSYLFYINNNTDKTVEKLKSKKKYEIIYEDLDKNFLKKDRIRKLLILREKLLVEAKKKTFDYMVMIDSDVIFNGSMVKEAFKVIKEKDLEITGLNTLAYPMPFFYDWSASDSNSSFFKIIISSILSNQLIQTDSFFNGFLIFKNTNKFQKEINYYDDTDKNYFCEHEIICKKIKDSGLKINIIPYITPIYAERAKSYPSVEQENKDTYEKLYKKIETNDNDYRNLKFYLLLLIVLIVLIVLIYKLLKNLIHD